MSKELFETISYLKETGELSPECRHLIDDAVLIKAYLLSAMGAIAVSGFGGVLVRYWSGAAAAPAAAITNNVTPSSP